MGLSQKDSGKAFEYACLRELVSQVSPFQPLKVIQDTSFQVAEDSYNKFDSSQQTRFTRAANVAMQHIVSIEPNLYTPSPSGVILALSLQPDGKGISGDVRDILCTKSLSWELGISCKHNHDAVKHSRLSPTIDWGKEWLGSGCSSQYWADINPIFAALDSYIRRGQLWSDIPNKVNLVYRPILKAFENELQRIVKSNPLAPANLVHYLLGREDFYKVITHDKTRSVSVQGFSFLGKLGLACGAVKTKQPSLNKRLPLPTKIVHVDYPSTKTSTIEVICDSGWAFSLRIHNASSRVENSLKFDIRLIGTPPALYSHQMSW